MTSCILLHHKIHLNESGVFPPKLNFKLSSPFSQGATYTSDNVSNGVWFFKLCVYFIYYVIYRLLISLRVLWLTLYHWYQKWALEEWQTTSYSVDRLAFCFPPACGCYSSRRSCPGHFYWSDYLLESFCSYLQINRWYSTGLNCNYNWNCDYNCMHLPHNCIRLLRAFKPTAPRLGCRCYVTSGHILCIYNGNKCGENYRVMESKHF